jgi:predicted transcriptional regulator
MNHVLPALWRTCRVIANKRRLHLLWCLFDRGSLCVFELAENLGISESQASAHLQTLASHGLIQQYRRKMRLINSPEADPRITSAPALTESLHACYKKRIPVQSVFRQATAFTHSRRIEIIRALSATGLSLEELSRKTQIPETALNRHMNKLSARGFVQGNNDLYIGTVPNDNFSRTLLQLIAEFS